MTTTKDRIDKLLMQLDSEFKRDSYWLTRSEQDSLRARLEDFKTLVDRTYASHERQAQT